MADEQNNIERRAALEMLYLRNFNHVEELIQSDPRTTFDEADKIIESVAGHLDDYSGPLTDAAYREWVTALLLPVLGFHGIKHTCQKTVRDAIKDVFAGYGGRGDTETARDDAEQQVWIWVLLHLSQLLDPEARPTAWLAKIAKYEAMTIRRRMVRGNQRLAAEIDAEQLGRSYDDRFVIESRRDGTEDKFDEKRAHPYARVEDVKMS
jgi:hypothetical protein